MPTTLALADILELKVFAWGEGQLGINTGHFLFNGATTGSVSVESMLAEFSTMMAAVYKPAMGSVVNFIGVTGRRVTPTVSPVVINTGDAGLAAVASDLLPTQVCGIFTKRTLRTGRAGRGRCYVPFPVELFNDVDGKPNETYTDLLESIANSWCETFAPTIPAVTGATFSPVIFHRASGGYDLITSKTVRVRWAGQHRRGDYGKLNPRPF